uniref:Uncharacterized protein n=1 Tax=Anguilla anguilla TaxID=7936 RepID=A0A0E9SQ05_ANGAN
MKLWGWLPSRSQIVPCTASITRCCLSSKREAAWLSAAQSRACLAQRNIEHDC